MQADNLPKAIAVHAELKLWQEARKRCDLNIFKSAMLRVADMAHGHQGQNAETVIQVPPSELIGFADAQIARLQAELAAFGVDL